MKLYWEISQFKEQLDKRADSDLTDHLTAAYQAFNTAVTAWHLTDWLWESFSDENKKEVAEIYKLEKASLGEFQKCLIKMSPSLRVCKEIANGSKHKTSRGNIEAKLEWGRAQIRLGKIKVGERTMSYPYELFVLDENGSTQLMEVFVKAAKFWRNELVRLGFLEPELIG